MACLQTKFSQLVCMDCSTSAACWLVPTRRSPQSFLRMLTQRPCSFVCSNRISRGIHHLNIMLLTVWCHSSFSFPSCPVGKRRLGATQCIDKDECEKPGLCENGATCVNLSDNRHFQCLCAPGWAGTFCREPAPVGNVLYGGRDFIIVFVFCILSLLGNFFVVSVFTQL